MPFSPWRHQDFEDVKVALMSAVLDRLAQEITDPDDEQHERIGRLSRFKEKLRASGRWVGRTTLAGAPAAVTALAAVDPTLVPLEVLPIAQAVVGAAASEGQRALASSSAKTTTSVGSATDVEITNSTEFHRQFEELVENLTDVQAVRYLSSQIETVCVFVVGWLIQACSGSRGARGGRVNRSGCSA